MGYEGMNVWRVWVKEPPLLTSMTPWCTPSLIAPPFLLARPVYAPDKELKIEVWRPLGPGLGGKLLQVTVKPTSRGLPVPVQRSERRHALW